VGTDEIGEPAFGPSIICPVTLEGSLHATVIAKVDRALIGHISRATLNNAAACTADASTTILQSSPPWHVHYFWFQGTLPNITALRTLSDGVAFRMDEAFACLFLTEHGRPAIGIFNRNTVTKPLTSVDVSGEITRVEGCAVGTRPTGVLSGRSTSLTQLGAAAA
jgi:hypothetical protein